MTRPTNTSDLHAALPGAVLAPGSAGYEARCSGWDRRFVHRPAALVIARDAHDVATAVQHAGRHDLEVVVQATGHAPVRSADHDARLVDVSGLDVVRFEERTGIATVGGGARWTTVLDTAHRAGHGWTAVAPAHRLVGVAGSVLAGGFGWLARAHGMSRDRVVAADVVLASGELVRVSADHRADILWALRGGGAPAPGVVTGLTLELVRQPHVYLGELRYPAEMAPEVLARYGERVAEVPAALTSAVELHAGPPAWIAVRACHAGPVVEGRAWLDDWCRWADVARDRFTVGPPSLIGRLDDEPASMLSPAGTPVSTTAWLRRLGDDAISILSAAVLAHRVVDRVDILHAGGAIRPGFGPRPHGATDLLLRVTAIPQALAATVSVERQLAALHSELLVNGAISAGSYVGFTDAKDSTDRAPAASTS